MTQLFLLAAAREVLLLLLFCLAVPSSVTGLLEHPYDSIAHVIANLEVNAGLFQQTEDPVSFDAKNADVFFVREPSLISSPEHTTIERETHHAAWMGSGKYQGDIDGISPSMFQEPVENVFYNGLRNKKLMWPNGLIPYKLDTKFTQSEKSLLEKAFQTYRERTCIRFEPHTPGQVDFLLISKGYGCYSQVGRNGGQQEMSLGRGCLFHEIIVHELMHAVGFWHEHSRSDRDSFIRINWSNILPGMQGQFDKISSSFQDLLGETYDYKSVMHYDSTAFSKNGQNTIETIQPGFTSTIGAAVDLSDADVKKINKLYNCVAPTTVETTTTGPATSRVTPPRPRELISVVLTTTTSSPGPRTPTTPQPTESSACQDRFLDCPYFHLYCERTSFYFVMKSYCPLTCKHCTRSR